MGKTFYKLDDEDKVWWVDHPDKIGIREFSFDKKTVYNLYTDYPDKLTPEEKEIFDMEYPLYAQAGSI